MLRRCRETGRPRTRLRLLTGLLTALATACALLPGAAYAAGPVAPGKAPGPTASSRQAQSPATLPAKSPARTPTGTPTSTPLRSQPKTSTKPRIQPRAAGSTDDWPTSLHDAARTAASADTTLSTANAPSLTRLWTLKTGGPVATTPTVTGGVAYFASWDGNEYAVNATTGAVLWKTNIGYMTPNQPCGNPPSAGPSSPATVVGNVVYVGGADSYWYALDTVTGAVDWRVWVGGSGVPGVYDGHMNWSGPLIVGNYAYVGVASFGDCPLVQGQLLKVNLTTHAIENTANLVPNGQVGGGIWTSPAYDTATGLIYVATGTRNLPSQTWAQAFLAVDSTTMEVKDSWALPDSVAVVDSDFGTSTTLFTDQNGRGLVAAINKNGVAYAFDRAHLSQGPVWQAGIAVGGTCPTCGQSSVSSGAFGGGALYLAGATGAINGVEYPGTVRALDPATGGYLWQHAAPGMVIGALAYDNGLVLDGGGSVLEVLDANTGNRLYSYDTGTQIYGGPSVAGGIIFTGNTAGQVVAFGLPASTTTPPADPSCPSGFTCQDIGGPTPAGVETVTGTGGTAQWKTVTGGPGISAAGTPKGSADAFRLLSRPTAGDAQVTAQLTAQPSGGSSLTGVMIRQNSDPGSPYYALLEGPYHNIKVMYRRAFGGATSVVYNSPGPALPVYLTVQRTGDLLQAAISSNGTGFTLLPGTSTSIALPYTSLAGVAANSGAVGVQATAKLTSVSVGAPTSSLQPAVSANPCPSGWSCQDVGNPALVGDQTLTGGSWTVKGAGGDIWGNGDQFHYVWQPVTGDSTVSAQVTSQSNTNASAKAGVMLRGGTDAGAAYYAAFVTPGNGIQVQYRDTAGGSSAQIANPSGAAPAYLRIARSGTSFTAYTSADGSAWTAVPASTIALPNLGGGILAGLAVGSHNTGTLSTAAIGGVTIDASAPTPPNLCATGWSCEDIGSPLPAGSQSYNAATGAWSVIGGGGDLWGSSDQFRLVSQPQNTDGTTSAQVSAQQNSDGWAKSGLMTRLNDSPNAPYYAVLVTPANGVIVQYRSVQNGQSTQLGGVSGTPPLYLRIGRAGQTFTAYTSSDGTTWTAFPGSAQTINALSGTLLSGMAVCSHNTAASNTTAYTGVTITGTGTSAGLPYPWADTDVGSPALAGSASYAGSTFTVNGGGTDIWGGTDQFHYVDQPLSSDVSLVARVSAQSNTDPWARSGIIIKQSTTAGSAYAMVAVTPGNGVNFSYGFNTTVGGAGYSLPNAWVRLDRTGNVFTAYSSADGLNWTRLGQATIAMTPTVTLGLAVSAHSATVLNTTTFDNVIVTPIGGGPLPSPWTSTDIGGPGIPGSANYSAANGNVFTLNGSGADIWGSTDQEQYAYQPLTGDGSVTARVTGQDITDPWAKSGVMFKESTTPGSPYVLLAVTPGNQLHLEYGYASDIAVGTFNLPNAWLRLTRTGNSFTGYTSADGAHWTAVATLNQTMASAATVGMEVCSHNNQQLNATTFDNVAVSGALPAVWTSSDVGSPALAGSASYQNGVYTVNGGGNDIWGSTDQFHYLSQPLTGNGTLTVRVTAQQNTSGWAKSGLMVKQSTASGSAYAALLVTPGNGVHLQSNFNADQSGGAATLPDWLRLSRVGTAVTAYTSADGVTWTQLGTPVTVALTDPVTIGLFVCSHNGGQLNTSTFDNVSVSTP
ncbi:outer membrane protein assembly factor BamB [Streptacidiphilus sp. MAP12-16]|uniref:outer membrane protein assembly factor BamB family protein n=1 Tax=Streptacidiphilus sp. MAP12-16 TaxID=3156300 RepID=UPI0035121DFE